MHYPPLSVQRWYRQVHRPLSPGETGLWRESASESVRRSSRKRRRPVTAPSPLQAPSPCGKGEQIGMVNAGFFRAAGAYLAMCPAVICGGEGGEGSVLMRQQHQLRQHHGASSAWVTLPSSHTSSVTRAPARSAQTFSRPAWKEAREAKTALGLGSNDGPTTVTATWSTIPARVKTHSSKRGHRPTLMSSSPSSSSLSLSSSSPSSSRLVLSTSSSTAPPTLLCMAQDQQRYAVKPSWLAGRSVVSGSCPRGRGFHLGAVAAVRSSGEGGSAATTAVEGGEEFREAFEAVVGDDGLLSIDGFKAMADVRNLLEDGLLREPEVLAIWEAVKKADTKGDRVDYTGFLEAFSRVDAIFEDEEEEESVMDKEESIEISSGGGDTLTPGEEEESRSSFVELVGSSEGLLDLQGLLRWSEVMELLEEGLVTQLEVEKLWAGLPKVGNSVDAAGAKGTAKGTLINLQGFLEFDRQLSDLFEADDTNADATTITAAAAAAAVAVAEKPAPTLAPEESVPQVEEDREDATPESQFAELTAATGGLLTLDGLLGWIGLSELLNDDLMTQEEVETMFEALPKPGSGSGDSSIDLVGFLEFARQMDSMFEDDTVTDNDANTSSSPRPPSSPSSPSPKTPTAATTPVVSATADRPASGEGATPLPSLSSLARASSSSVTPEGGAVAAAEARALLLALAKGEMADCGMGCGEEKRAQMIQALDAFLAFEEGNLVLGDDLGTGLLDALVGDWRLLYTSSNAMEYNQGLTGLANTIPNASFRGLKQVMHADGMVFDAEYEEELCIGDESDPLVITVTSDWEVKQTSSLITGKSTVAVSVSPKEIKYGFITVRSGRWKTLRAMMLLDIAYLDGDLRIMRSQTARQNFFIFMRV